MTTRSSRKKVNGIRRLAGGANQQGIVSDHRAYLPLNVQDAASGRLLPARRRRSQQTVKLYLSGSCGTRSKKHAALGGLPALQTAGHPRPRLPPEGPAKAGRETVIVFRGCFRRRLAIKAVVEGEIDKEVLEDLDAEL
jgi:hypothetical protein